MSVLLLLLMAADGDRTTVRVEVILPRDGRGTLAAQSWGRWFDAAGYAMTTQRDFGMAEPGVEETARGRLRTVRVTFAMDRRGGLQIAGKSFPPGGSDSLAKYLAELKEYGAGGRPDKQPQWGLSREALDPLEAAASSDAIAARTTAGLAGEMADRFGLAVQLGEGVSGGQRLPEPPPVACGTAAAWQLAMIDAGWEPRRQPDGSVVIVIDTQDRLGKPWPIGWPVPRRIRSDRPVPAMFRPIAMPETRTQLAAFLDHVADATQTAVLPIEPLGEPARTDPVLVQRAESAPYPIVKRLLARHRLTTRIHLDDAGRGFVAVQPFDPSSGVPSTVSPLIPTRVKQRLLALAAAEGAPRP